MTPVRILQPDTWLRHRETHETFCVKFIDGNYITVEDEHGKGQLISLRHLESDLYEDCDKPEPKMHDQQQLVEILIADNKRLRDAGCEMAEAAMRVAREYDGVHRLMLACSKWSLAVANEGGRERHNESTSSSVDSG